MSTTKSRGINAAIVACAFITILYLAFQPYPNILYVLSNTSEVASSASSKQSSIHSGCNSLASENHPNSRFFILFSLLPLATAQTSYSIEVGTFGDDASRGNMGVSVEIRTHVPSLRPKTNQTRSGLGVICKAAPSFSSATK